MIEQYIYNLITADEALTDLLGEGEDIALYPNSVPTGTAFERAVTFTLIGTTDRFPKVEAPTVQFNIFARTHTDTAAIAKALADLFNQQFNRSSGGVEVYYSQRMSESDLGFQRDDNVYQREATYSFKIR